MYTKRLGKKDDGIRIGVFWTETTRLSELDRIDDIDANIDVAIALRYYSMHLHPDPMLCEIFAHAVWFTSHPQTRDFIDRYYIRPTVPEITNHKSDCH